MHCKVQKFLSTCTVILRSGCILWAATSDISAHLAVWNFANIQHWQNNDPVAQAVEGGCHVYWYAQDKFIRSHCFQHLRRVEINNGLWNSPPHSILQDIYTVSERKLWKIFIGIRCQYSPRCVLLCFQFCRLAHMQNFVLQWTTLWSCAYVQHIAIRQRI